jgi:hypothetical protein
MIALKSMIARLRSALGWRRPMMQQGSLTCTFREETWAFHFEIKSEEFAHGCVIPPEQALRLGHWLTKQAERRIRGDA